MRTKSLVKNKIANLRCHSRPAFFSTRSFFQQYFKWEKSGNLGTTATEADVPGFSGESSEIFKGHLYKMLCRSDNDQRVGSMAAVRHVF